MIDTISHNAIVGLLYIGTIAIITACLLSVITYARDEEIKPHNMLGVVVWSALGILMALLFIDVRG